jgi:hypothetical protein
MIPLEQDQTSVVEEYQPFFGVYPNLVVATDKG